MTMDDCSREPALSDPEHFPPAGFWIRAGAAFIDSLAAIGAIILISPLFRLANYLFSRDPLKTPDAELWIMLILPPIAYHAVAIGRFGKTYGTRFADIGVIRMNGEKAGYSRALVRALALLLEPFLLFAGCVIGVFTPHKRMLHDYVAGTRVVHLGNAPAAQKWAMIFLGVCLPFAMVFTFLYLGIPRRYG